MVDRAQALTFGWYRFVRRRWIGQRLQLECLEEGVFHADDLARRDPDGLSVLRRFVDEHHADTASDPGRRIRLLTRTQFVDQVLFPTAFRSEATVVCFNAPFDLSRLAIDVGEARGRYYGGFSFPIWTYQNGRQRRDHPWRPRIAIRSLDSRRSLMGFSAVRADDPALRRRAFRGHFVDLRTLAFALTDTSYSLRSACAAFLVEDGKAETDDYGCITPAFVAYATGRAGTGQPLRERHGRIRAPSFTICVASYASSFSSQFHDATAILASVMPRGTVG